MFQLACKFYPLLMAPSQELLDQIAYFEKHRAEFVQRHYKAFALIYRKAAEGFYPSGGDAYRVARRRRFKSGAFLIRQCIPFAEEKPAVFHSRVL